MIKQQFKYEKSRQHIWAILISIKISVLYTLKNLSGFSEQFLSENRMEITRALRSITLQFG